LISQFAVSSIQRQRFGVEEAAADDRGYNAKRARDRHEGGRDSAPGGGKGLVWVNASSHVYHSQKSRWYGKTKQGQYMSEEQAKEDGNRPAGTANSASRRAWSMERRM
jgi:hypothetical protein